MTDTAYKNLEELGTVKLFDLLGLTGTAEEEEAMANQLTDGLWTEFTATDMMDDLSEETVDDLEDTLEDESLSEEKRSEKLAKLVEKDMPDIKKRFTHKVLELKADLVHERVMGLQSYFEKNDTALHEIDRVKELMKDGKWSDAVNLLNKTVTTHRKPEA